MQRPRHSHEVDFSRFYCAFYPVLTLALLCRADSVKSSIPSTGNQGTQSYCVHPLAKALHSAMSNE